jgi:hypothetical protein
MIVNQMTGVRANFMAEYERVHGRKAETTRPELIALEQTWGVGAKGTYGYELRFPSWLTTDDYRPKEADGTPARGRFTLPWSEYDAWVVSETAAKDEANKVLAEKAAVKATKKAETARKASEAKALRDAKKVARAEAKAKAKAEKDAAKAKANATDTAVSTITAAVTGIENSTPSPVVV